MKHYAKRYARVFATMLGTLALGGCGCNLVGCMSGLTVRLATMPPGAFHVELIVAGQVLSAPVYATCTPPTACYPNIYFDHTPSEGTVRVTTPAGTRVTEFRNLIYTKNQPNGRGCSPTCWSASVTVQVPL